MFATKIQTLAAIVLVAFLYSGVWLARYGRLREEHSLPFPLQLPQDAGAKLPEIDADNSRADEGCETSPFGFVVDFGKVQRGTMPTRIFRFVNASNVPLKINLVSGKSCASGAVNVRTTKWILLPYEEGQLEISVDTKRFKGPKSVAVYVETDNGKKMVTMLYVQADSRDGFLQLFSIL
jgi:hypothetical protein